MPIDAAVKHKVLAGNTAQSVYNNLRHLESNRLSVMTRWVWELLQNSRDAAAGAEGKLVASVEYADDSVIFTHNGKPFNQDEIAHLIFHGSTKIEDSSTIGQYGSGFLTTHLLSPAIDIAGQLATGQWFDFRLERRATSVDDLLQSMEDADSNFNPSPEPPSEKLPVGFTTRFRYPIAGAGANDAVKEGLKNLYECAPLAVSLNPEFSTINVSETKYSVQFKVIDREQLIPGEIEKITVAVSHNGHQQSRQYLVAKGGKASVAIPVRSHNGYEECLPLGDVPRLFLGFPLIGTEKFSFPAVINSLQFTPTEERNGVYLGQGDSAANETNQQVIEEGCHLLVKLIQFAAEQGYRNTPILAILPPIVEQNWLHGAWLRNLLANNFIPSMRRTPAVLNHSGSPLPPMQATLPLAEGDASVESLWDLLSQLAGTIEELPRREEAPRWCDAVKSWATITGQDAVSIGDAVGGRNLAETIGADAGTLADFQSLLSDGAQAIEWLNGFHQYIADNGLRDVVKDFNIVPAQDGRLDKLQALYRDDAIATELKDIAELLGWQIRGELRNTQIHALAGEVGKGPRIEDEVVDALIRGLKRRAQENPGSQFGKASARLFSWLAQHERWDSLGGFPVFAAETGSAGLTVIHLPASQETDGYYLAPVKAWHPKLQEFAGIFPASLILSNDFFDLVPNIDVWQKLNEHRLAIKDVLVKRYAKVNDFFPEGIVARERDEHQEMHRTVDSVAVADIVRRSEMMAFVQDGPTRAILLWRFLLNWLSVENENGLEITEAECECKETHRYYPGVWLSSVRGRPWIRVSPAERKMATAESLATLLLENNLSSASLTEDPIAAKLLEAMGIRLFDLTRLMLAPTSDEAREQQDRYLIGILEAAQGDVAQLAEAQRHIQESRKRTQITRNNQDLGRKVEELVEQSLKGEGFSVRRTGIGSDFEIDHDFIEDDKEVGLEVIGNGKSWLVEVKATRDQRVRMTETQAKTAVEKGSGFLLCVVPVASETAELGLDEVRDKMRFVLGIGPKVGHLQQGFDGFTKEYQAADPGVQLDIGADSRRVRVFSSVWETEGIILDDLPGNLK